MRYIDQEKIYKATDHGLDIFKHYFTNLQPGQKFKARDEDDASAQVDWYQGYYRITDFGNPDVKGLKAIPFVMQRENLEYYDALRYIEDVILNQKVEGSGFKRSKFAADYQWRDMQPEDEKGNYKFTYKKKPSKKDLEAIGRYVDEDTLKKYNCRAVEKYEYCAHSKKMNKDIVHIFKSNEDYPIFVFDYGDFKKIYKPHELQKKFRFVWVGECPDDFVFGLKQIQKAENEFVDTENDEDEEAVKRPDFKPNAIVHDVFRCSGESDALNVASLGKHVYWLNSETKEMTSRMFNQVDDLCENHFQILDMDETGKEQAKKIALQHINLFTLEIPEWIKNKKDWRGKTCKDIKDWINLAGRDIDHTLNIFGALKRSAKPAKFWTKVIEKDKEGRFKSIRYDINLEYYFHFLNLNGFYTMPSSYHRNSTYCYARMSGKVIELVHPNEIKRITKKFTRQWIKSKYLHDEIPILNKINSSMQISENTIEQLPEINPEFRNCDKETEYIHFKNGSLKIRRDKIEKIKHEQVPNYILGKLDLKQNNKEVISHLINRNIRLIEPPAIEVNATKEYQELLDKAENASSIDERERLNVELAQFDELDRYEVKINDPDFIFVRFLKDISYLYWRKELELKQELTEREKKEQDLLLANLMFVMGYQGSEYKNPARPWISFMQDMLISKVGKSAGRSGKGLIAQSWQHVRPTYYIEGRRSDITKKTDFIFDGYTRYHNNLFVDDFYEYGDINFFYTQASGPRKINSKFISPETLSYEDSGKLHIDSNFELQNTDSSTLARILNCGVSDYYHESSKYNDYKETRSPFVKFGRRLYDDFTEEEWIKFYNLMAYCIQLQMRFFKIQPPMGNLEKRQLLREMTRGLGKDEDFFIWANHYFVNPPADSKPEDVSPEDNGYYNRYVIKELAYKNFIGTLEEGESKKYKSTFFRRALEAYCRYHGFELNPESMCNGEENKRFRRITKTIDGNTREVVFIWTGGNTETEEEAKTRDEDLEDQTEINPEGNPDELPF